MILRIRTLLVALLFLQATATSSAQRPNTAATGAPTRKSIIEETTTAHTTAPESNQEPPTIAPFVPAVTTDTTPSGQDDGGVFVTGFISTTREEYQRDRPMESAGTGGGGGGGLLFDPTGGIGHTADSGFAGGEEGLMGHDGHLGLDYHVPEKCHTYIPDHLAGDDDYCKCWWMDVGCIDS